LATLVAWSDGLSWWESDDVLIWGGKGQRRRSLAGIQRWQCSTSDGGPTYLLAADDDGNLEGQLLLELLDGGREALALGAALGVVVLFPVLPSAMPIHKGKGYPERPSPESVTR